LRDVRRRESTERFAVFQRNNSPPAVLRSDSAFGSQTVLASRGVASFLSKSPSICENLRSFVAKKPWLPGFQIKKLKLRPCPH
jgi:hypothetical protein